jgi:hypothetical protein
MKRTAKQAANQRKWLAKIGPDMIRQLYREAKWRERGIQPPTRPEPKVCECCRKVPGGIKRLCLDHDHVTGEFRGWLCSKCNTALGMLGDTLADAQNLVSYLTRVAKINILPRHT